MKKALLTLILIVPLAVVSDAQTADRVLLPVMSSDTPGAYGSLWRTELWIHNLSDQLLDIGPTQHPECRSNVGGVCDSSVRIGPGGTAWRVGFPLNPPGEPPGFFLYTRAGDMANASFNLRVRDMSRQALTWGTEVPTVLESDLQTLKAVIVNVPFAARFRATLRVYDLDARPSSVVRVRLEAIDKRYGSSPGFFLREDVLNLATPAFNGTAEMPRRPGYAQILDLSQGIPDTYVEDGVARPLEQFRITIEPLTPGLRFWGYVSVVNNETQHMTTIVPN